MPGPAEIAMLLVLATILFGPEKIPAFARKAARVVHFLRNIANNAQDQLRAELGPEYADLDIRDLNPKTFVQKHILSELQDDIDEIKTDLAEVKSDLDANADELSSLAMEVRSDLEGAVSATDGAVSSDDAGTPFDPDAT